MLNTLTFWNKFNINRLPDAIRELPSDTDAQIRECRWSGFQDSDFCVLLIRFSDNEQWTLGSMRRA